MKEIKIEKEDIELYLRLIELINKKAKVNRADIEDCLFFVKKYIYPNVTVCYSCIKTIQKLFKYVKDRINYIKY